MIHKYLSYILISWIGAMGFAAAPQTPRIIPRGEFIRLACQRDTLFRQILIDEAFLKYKKILELPSRDVLLSLTGQYNYVLDPEKSSGPAGSIGLSKLFPDTGSMVSAGYHASPNNTATTMVSGFSFAFAQPIVKNAFGSGYRLQDKIKGLEIKVIRHQIAEAYEDYLAALEKIYYNWYSAHANMKAAQAALKENERLLANTRAKQARRIAKQVDVDKIHLQTIARQERLITVETAFVRSSDLVRKALGLNADAPIAPEDPKVRGLKDTDFKTAMGYLWTKSRTGRILTLLNKKASLDVQQAADALLPSTNLMLGYDIAGGGFTVESPVHVLSAGIALEMNIFGQKEQAGWESQKISRRKTALVTGNTRLQLEVDLKAIYLQIHQEKKRLDLADQKIRLSKKILAAEDRDYRIGRSLLNDLLIASNQLEENSFNKVDCTMRLNILTIEWLRLTDQLVLAKAIVRPSAKAGHESGLPR